MTQLTYDVLRKAVEGHGVALRAVTRLEPVGGQSDKIFPPTFGDVVTVPPPLEGESAVVGRRTKYAVEWRRISGTSRLCVLLDSVASQANRMEEALRDGWDSGDLSFFPMVRVDFTDQKDEDPALDLTTLGGDGYLSVLEVPHRLSDALVRDSLLGGVPFRASPEGRRFTEASPVNAIPLYDLCPTGLVFGLWDSTGPKGGLGAKFQRALVSEIIGVGVELGAKTESRIDPTGIKKTPIYEAANPDEDWTEDPDQAKRDRSGKAVLLKRGGQKAGTPAVINHGNVTPNVETLAGGVTIDYAEQITVLSLAALRRLRFPRAADGTPLNEDRRAAESSARTALAALALAAVVYSRENGYDLRSRCALRAMHGLNLELIPADGAPPITYSLDAAAGRELLRHAAAQAAGAGLKWRTDTIDLSPTPKLIGLIRRSRQLTIADDEAGG